MTTLMGDEPKDRGGCIVFVVLDGSGMKSGGRSPSVEDSTEGERPSCAEVLKSLLLFPVEVILGGVRNPCLLAHEIAGLGGGLAAHGVQSLDVGHLAKDAMPLGLHR